MTYKNNDLWAIVNGNDDKVSTILITDWPGYEWDEFLLLRKHGQIMCFAEEKNAIKFIFDKFDKSQISSELLNEKEKDAPEGYHW